MCRGRLRRSARLGCFQQLTCLDNHTAISISIVHRFRLPKRFKGRPCNPIELVRHNQRNAKSRLPAVGLLVCFRLRMWMCRTVRALQLVWSDKLLAAAGPKGTLACSTAQRRQLYAIPPDVRNCTPLSGNQLHNVMLHSLRSNNSASNFGANCSRVAGVWGG